MTAPAKLGGRPAGDEQVRARGVAGEHAPALVRTRYRFPAAPVPVPPDSPAVQPRPAPPRPRHPVRPARPPRLAPPRLAPPRSAGPVPSSGSGRVAPGHPVAVPGPRLIHLVLAVVLTLVVVGALAWLGQTAETGLPAETAVIRVGAGETVWDVAERVAPGSDPRAVVQRIRELNVMTGSAVQPGQQLRVPDGR